MRRIYAFEAEELSPEVQTQLEKVEDVVEEKCDTPEACDKMIDKIDDEKEKFNGALKDMASAAKDCQDGKCSKSEMAAAITPKMAELKEVAKSIGVASEGEALTEGELKDAKAYLDGAKEIVEAKKDELENGSDSKDSDDSEGSDDECEECDEETEEAAESYLEDLDFAMESSFVDMALEGTNIDALKTRKAHVSAIRAAKKEMKAAAKSGDYKTAAAKAREAAQEANALASDISGLDQSAGSAAIVGIAIAVVTIMGTIGVGSVAGGFANKHKVYKGMLETAAGGTDPVGVAKLASKSKTVFAKGAKKGAAVGAGVGAGVSATAGGATAIAKVLKSKGVEDTGDAKKLQPNDLNALLSAIKVDAKRMAKAFEKKAAEYEKQASAPAAESFLAEDSVAMELFGRNTKRTVNMDDMAVIKAYVEANADSMKSGDEVSALMDQAKSEYEAGGVDYDMPKLTKTTINGIPILITTDPTGAVKDFQFSTGGKRFKAVKMSEARSKVGKGLRKQDREAGKAAKAAASEEGANESFSDFIAACESLIGECSENPYLFD